MPPLNKSYRLTATAIAICLVTTSCATYNEFSSSNSNTTNCLAGGVFGALAGAALVAASGKGDQGALIAGAAVGAAAGCGMALYYKNRLQRLEQLAKEENLSLQVETLQTTATSNAKPEEAGIVQEHAVLGRRDELAHQIVAGVLP